MTTSTSKVPVCGARVLLPLAVVAAVACPLTSHAQKRVGDEFRVNSYTTGSQELPSVGVAPDSTFVVVWSSYGQDGSGYGIFFQRFTSSGTPIGAGNIGPINNHTTADQSSPSVAVDGAGNFVIAWHSFGQDGDLYGVFRRRFTDDGAALGGEVAVNTYTTSTQAAPSVAIDASGDFVIVWQSYGRDGSSYGIAGRHSTGGSGEFGVNSYATGSQASPSVAMDTDGDFVVVWSGNGQGDSSGIFGRRFNSGSSEGLGEFKVNGYTTGSQANPAVAMDAAGNFVVVWQGAGQGDGYFGIFGQRYTSGGVASGVEFKINTYTTSTQTRPSVVMDAVGNFVVVWESYGQDGNGRGIFGQRFTSSGARLGGEFRVNTHTTSDQVFPSVAMGADGNFVVVWHSCCQDGNGRGVFGQRFRFAELDFFIGDDEDENEGVIR